MKPKKDRKKYLSEWYQENKERLDEGKRKWAKENPEKVRGYGRKSYSKNRESNLKKEREHRKNNREYHNEKGARFYSRNKDLLRMRRELKKLEDGSPQLIFDISLEEIERKKEGLRESINNYKNKKEMV